MSRFMAILAINSSVSEKINLKQKSQIVYNNPTTLKNKTQHQKKFKMVTT